MHVYMRVSGGILAGQERALIPGVGITGSWELPEVGAKNRTQVLGKSSKHL